MPLKPSREAEGRRKKGRNKNDTGDQEEEQLDAWDLVKIYQIKKPVTINYIDSGQEVIITQDSKVRNVLYATRLCHAHARGTGNR
jgi:hypothetical protein